MTSLADSTGATAGASTGLKLNTPVIVTIDGEVGGRVAISAWAELRGQILNGFH